MGEDESMDWEDFVCVYQAMGLPCQSHFQQTILARCYEHLIAACTFLDTVPRVFFLLRCLMSVSSNTNPEIVGCFKSLSEASAQFWRPNEVAGDLDHLLGEAALGVLAPEEYGYVQLANKMLVFFCDGRCDTDRVVLMNLLAADV